MNMKKNKLPKWFDGVIYEKGETVANQFSGEEIYLNAEELSMYDLIKGAEMVAMMSGWNDEYIELIQKGIKWMRKNNPKAYMVLLD
tara:strand:+ start:416 stop:673 length:258 start_codon:yes stop_codon:yes gene_type:complete